MTSAAPDRRRWRGGVLAVGGLVVVAGGVALVVLGPGAVEATSTAIWIRVCSAVVVAASLMLVAADLEWVRTGAAPRGPITAAAALAISAIAVAILGAAFFLVQDGPDATTAPALALFVIIHAGVALLLVAITRREST